MSPFAPRSRRHTSTFRLVRAGSLPESVADATSQIDTFASSAASQSPVLVIARDGGAIVQYLVLTGKGDHQMVAEHLAKSMGATTDELPDDEELTLDGSGVHQLKIPMWRPSDPGRSTMAGQDPHLLSQYAARNLSEDGQWIAVAFRAPFKRERKKWGEFMRSAQNVETHHSLERDAVMASFFAGGGDASSNRAVLDAFAASMPGFDEFPKPARTGVFAAVRAALIVAAVGALVVAGVLVGADLLEGVLAGALAASGSAALIGVVHLVGLALVAVAAAASLLLVAWFVGTGVAAARAPIPVNQPRFRLRPTDDPKPVKGEDGKTKRDDSGKVKLSGGKRPLRRDVFKVSPAVFAGMVCPHLGNESGSSSTRSRTASPEVTSTRCGFALGVDGRGSRVHLPAVSTFEGCAIVGGPGTGKSQLQEAQFAYQLMERVHPSGMDHAPTDQNALVFFDTKGETWRALKAWADRFGVDARVIHVADDPWETLDANGLQAADPVRRQNSDVIDVLWARGNADRRARFVADMLKQSLDEGAVQGQSLETLTKVFTGAFATTPAMVEAARAAAVEQGVPFIPAGDAVTPVSIAWALLGDPDPKAGELIYAQLRGQAAADQGEGVSTDAVLGAQALASLYGESGPTPAGRRALLQAPRNKVSLLQGAPWFWDIADHTGEVGSHRPGSAQDVAERRAASGFSSVQGSNPFAGFTTVPDPDAEADSAAVDTTADEADAVDVPDGSDGSDAAIEGRRVLTWDDLLRNHEVVIVNTGIAPDSGTQMTQEATELVASLIFFSLVQSIKRVANGWRDQGRRITLMADELSMIAEDNATQMEWLRDKGRSYGVELSWATQRQHQLPPKVRDSFMGFGTLIAFTQDNEVVAESVASNLAADGSEWSKQDVVNLEAYSVIIRTRTGHRLAAFTAALTDFESEPDLFEARQLGTVLLPGEVERAA